MCHSKQNYAIHDLETQLHRIDPLFLFEKETGVAQFGLANKGYKAFFLAILQKPHSHQLTDAYFVLKKGCEAGAKCLISE